MAAMHSRLDLAYSKMVRCRRAARRRSHLHRRSMKSTAHSVPMAGGTGAGEALSDYRADHCFSSTCEVLGHRANGPKMRFAKP